MTLIDLDETAMYKLRFFGYNISDGHMRWVLRKMADEGFSREDVRDAYHGFRVKECLEIFGLDYFEFYSLLIYHGLHIPSAQRRFASRRNAQQSRRLFTDDGDVKS